MDNTAQTEQPSAVDSTPRRPVTPGFMALYALATLGVYLSMLTPATVSLSLRMSQIAPDDPAGALALVASVGGVCALIGNPLFGRLSDRCTSRFGRRRPFILGGLLIAIPSVAAMGILPGVTGVCIAWCVAQLAIAGALAATTAVLVDQVPVHQRARMSGLVQIGIYVAILLGTFLVRLTPETPVPMFVLPAGIAVLLAVPLLLRLPDPVLHKASRPVAATRSWLSSIWVSPRKYPDFGWAWVSRFFVYMGAYVVTTFLTLLVINRLGLSAAEAASVVFFANLTYTAGIVVSAAFSGWLADRIGQYKPFVLCSAIVFGIGVLWLAFTTSLTGVLLGMLVGGLGMGTYASVDLALLTGVLPKEGSDEAKDMGLFQVAIALANSIVPALGPAFLAIGGGNNFPALFCASTAFALLGGLFVLPIRRVR